MEMPITNAKSNLPKQILLLLISILVVMLVIMLAVIIRNQWRAFDYIGRSDERIYTITIQGEGKVTAIPDIAQVSLGVQAEKIKVEDAQRENTQKMNDIIAALKGLNVEQKDIKTTNYNISPKYDWNNGTRILRGYIVSQNVTVKIRDLDRIGDILDKAADLGANQVGGLNFTIDEPEVLRQEAREKALASAKAKAESLAKVAEVKLGKLVSFNESGDNYDYPYYLESQAMMMDSLKVAEETTTIEPGSQDITVNVTVTYEVL
ncbi:MAG: SIMPL domain-containing protein [Patescibacteria group bacterium]|jgi:uncharacterized protein YggE|nr:SIMPL domain-containing protein [Patescibacteria group bacterium]